MNNNPLFTPLLTKDAPLASQTLLEQAHRYFGFVPNLLATLAHSPAALRVYLNADLGFQHGTLTPAEQQIVLLTASKENDCRYCTSSHSALARFFANVPGEVVIAIECGQPVADAKFNALLSSPGSSSRHGAMPRGPQSIVSSRRGTLKISFSKSSLVWA